MAYPVQSMAELINAIASAPPADPVDIDIIGSFDITGVNIPDGRTVNISSSMSPSPTLTRPANFPGTIFDVPPSSYLTISNVELDGNRQNAGTTAPLVTSRGTLTVMNATLKNNSSATSGGAISCLAGLMFITNGTFSNNHSDIDGGAVYCYGNLITLTGSTFISNTAAGNGGGVFYRSNSMGIVVSDTKFEKNTATNGGGMYLIRIDLAMIIDITGSCVFTGNRALQDGGALWVNELSALYVQQPVTFSSNRAAQGYFIEPADIPMHQTHILATVFTTPFTYGYNNFDINYRSNYPYREEGECDVVGSQTVDLCVPVTVTPSAVAGPTVVRCCGPAVITPGTNVCPGTPNPDCSFTISQRLCIEVPVEFSAEAVTGQTHTNCGTASGTSTCGELCSVSIDAEDAAAEANEEETAEDE